jgi:hypothetical protein
MVWCARLSPSTNDEFTWIPMCSRIKIAHIPRYASLGLVPTPSGETLGIALFGNEPGWIFSPSSAPLNQRYWLDLFASTIIPPMAPCKPLPTPHEVSPATCPLTPISGMRRVGSRFLEGAISGIERNIAYEVFYFLTPCSSPFVKRGTAGGFSFGYAQDRHPPPLPLPKVPPLRPATHFSLTLASNLAPLLKPKVSSIRARCTPANLRTFLVLRPNT